MKKVRDVSSNTRVQKKKGISKPNSQWTRMQRGEFVLRFRITRLHVDSVSTTAEETRARDAVEPATRRDFRNDTTKRQASRYVTRRPAAMGCHFNHFHVTSEVLSGFEKQATPYKSATDCPGDSQCCRLPLSLASTLAKIASCMAARIGRDGKSKQVSASD